jgi:hypothetical protein
MSHHPLGPAPGHRMGLAGREDSLAAILAGDLPVYGSPGWAAHPSTVGLWRWALGAHGAEVAWEAAEYLLRHGVEVQRGETTATILARRLAGSIREWRRGVSTHVTRHELLAGEVYDRLRDDPSPLVRAEPDAPIVSDYVAEAIGRQLPLSTARTLDDCALIAADRCMELRLAGRARPLGDLSGDGAPAGRLGRWLVAQVPDPTARRSTVRLLVGTYRVPQAAVLYQRARGARPVQVPVAIRASWAADALDLDPAAWRANDRKWARRLARRAVLAVPPTQLPAPIGQMTSAG